MPAIWFQSYTLEVIRERAVGTMAAHLGIEYVNLGENFLEGRMPVDARTHQPEGILHGGASVTLAETLASISGNLVVDPALEYCVGLEINANHLRAVRDGHVLGRSSPVHLGRTTQVWETRIFQGERPVCISRMTLAVLKR